MSTEDIIDIPARINQLENTIGHYPSVDSEIMVGGDSIYTEHVRVKDFLEIMRLAKFGYECRSLVRQATKW